MPAKLGLDVVTRGRRAAGDRRADLLIGGRHVGLAARAKPAFQFLGHGGGLVAVIGDQEPGHHAGSMVFEHCGPDDARTPAKKPLSAAPAGEAPPASVTPMGCSLEQLVVNLSERERQVFVLQWIYGYTGAEIGRMLGISHAAAKMAGHRARRKLRSLYQAA